jgi:uncharacterized protein
MIGMDAATGKRLEGDAHLRQSIGDILTTPLGTRIGRREYGSLLLELVDQPANPALRIRLYAAVALALLRWEPRIALDRVGFRQIGAGAFEVEIEGRRTDQPRPNLRTRLTVPVASPGGLPVYA